MPRSLFYAFGDSRAQSAVASLVGSLTRPVAISLTVLPSTANIESRRRFLDRYATCEEVRPPRKPSNAER